MTDDFMHREQLRPSLLTANLWYLLASAGLLILGIVGTLLADLPAVAPHRQTLSSFLNAFYEIFLLAIPAAIYAFFRRPAAPLMRLNRPKFRMLLYAAGLAALGVLMANSLTTWWLLLLERLGGTPQASGIAVPTTSSQLLVSLLTIGIIPGVCEEMLFRGGLMSAWERTGKRNALISTSVLFALLHGTIAGFPNQILMGLILGYIVIVSDSLFVGMVYHAVHNSITMLLASFASTALPAETAAEASLSLSESLGGAAGYASLLFNTFVMCALFVMLFQSMMNYAKKNGASLSLTNEAPPLPAPRFSEFIPLLLALTAAAFNYAADFMATFCG